MVRRSLFWLLCFQLSFGPAFAESVEKRAEVTQNAEDTQSNDKILAHTKEWTDEKKLMLPSIIEAVARLDAYTQDLEMQRGEKYLQELLDGNKLILQDPDLNCELSYRVIDGVRVPRLSIDGEIYLVIDRNLLSENSNHLQRYIYRVHFEAGGKGRKVNLILLQGSEEESIETRYLLKPKVTNYRWWKEYFLSKYKRPTKSDVTLSIATGVLMHAGLAKLVSFATDHPVPSEALVWTIAYSAFYGSFISTIRNWTILSGSRATRVLKSQLVSMLFAYGLVIAVGSGDLGDRLSTVGIFSVGENGFAWNPQGIAMNISIFANGIMNNFTKDFWNQIPRLRDMTRANTGEFDFKIKWLNKWTQWKRASIEGQIIYLIPWTINFLALTTLATSDWLKVPGTEISFPLFQFLSVPFAIFWAKTYARKLANRAQADPDLKSWSYELNEKANEQERVWDKTFGARLSDLPGHFKDWTVETIQNTKASVKNCWQELTGR